jgi:hypothetical protein
MERISFIKRLRYFAVLCLISFILMWVVFIMSLHNFKIFEFYILVYLIPQYIFGFIFLKTKRIYKLSIPLLSSIFSFGGLWWVVPHFLDIIETDILFNIIFVFLIIISWEIPYQILIKSHKKKYQ